MTHRRVRPRTVFRTLGVPLVDAVCVAVAVHISLWLRYDMHVPGEARMGSAKVIALAVVAHLIFGTLSGLYLRHYKPASFDEALGLAKTFVGTSAATIVGNIVLLDRAVPVSVSLVFGLIAMFLCSLVRWAWRADQERRIRSITASAPPLIVIGAGEAGAQIIAKLLRSRGSPYRPTAILDDDPTKRRLRLGGIPVAGTTADLGRVARSTGADTVLMAVPSATAEEMRTLSARADEAGLEVLVLPSVVDLLGDDVSVGDIRPLSEEDLLGRGQAEIDIEAIAGYLTGRRVLVTGAGGSIGSELCRQVHRFAPSELIMLDRDESALHGVELSIRGRATLEDRNLVVCDIRDAERLDEVFSDHRPEVVFHAAALKHLPLLEMHPGEGIKTNCIGTLNVLQASSDHGVDRLVNVSTDKAADPTSILGRTKRVAERLTATWGDDHPGTYLSVRFGNVLGSRGSVLTTFRSQVANGGPITVTHPDVTRYFMTVEEAVRLVIQAGASDLDGYAHVLDMGEPVRIADVAHRLASAADRPIEVVYTGLRPGEKLHEVLMSTNEMGSHTSHPLITEVPVKPLDPSVLDDIEVRGDPAVIGKALLAVLDDEPPVPSASSPSAGDPASVSTPIGADTET